MSLYIIKTLHIAGVMTLFVSLGAILLAGSEEIRKKGAMLHGISLLVIALAGFAFLKKPPMDQQWWMVKVAIWLFLGVVPVLAKRNVMPRGVLLGLSILAGALAGFLAISKYF
jgi:4-hydroxybenzoate polyprenyltransferase